MAVESYVDDILESSEFIFRSILSSIIGRSEENAKIEIVRQYSTVDTVLFEAIKSILDDLKHEEGLISRFFYRYFNFEFRKNKKRGQLIILGSQLKSQYEIIKQEKERVDFHLNNLQNAIDNLRKLSSALHNKRLFLTTKSKRNKSDALIKKVYFKIDSLVHYQLPLEQKANTLRDAQQLYSNLFERIPRYYELREESYIALLPSKI